MIWLVKTCEILRLPNLEKDLPGKTTAQLDHYREGNR